MQNAKLVIVKAAVWTRAMFLILLRLCCLFRLPSKFFRFENQNDTVEVRVPGGSFGGGLLTTAMRLSSLVCSILMASFASES